MSNLNMQNKFIETLKESGAPVSVYLQNGIKLQGKIIDFDDHSLLLGNTVTQLVYKHAISTIVPGAVR